MKYTIDGDAFYYYIRDIKPHHKEHFLNLMAERMLEHNNFPDIPFINKSRNPKIQGDYPKDFLLFWEAYPKKSAKKDALKAWLAEKEDSLLDKCLAALEWQTKEWKDLKYIPLPATYIRQGRYLDEKPRPSKPEETPLYDLSGVDL
jgi:hypothetical protein